MAKFSMSLTLNYINNVLVTISKTRQSSPSHQCPQLNVTNYLAWMNIWRRKMSQHPLQLEMEAKVMKAKSEISDWFTHTYRSNTHISAVTH